MQEQAVLLDMTRCGSRTYHTACHKTWLDPARVLVPASTTILELLDLNKQLSTTIREQEARIREQEARIREQEAVEMIDFLTALPNQRSLTATLKQELERSYRYHRTCSILFLDLDSFKAVNDKHGHSTGNNILREFAEVIRSLLRRADTVGRWGGEEFIVVLPETDETGAQAVAERLRTIVERHPFGSGLHLTCSIGSATYHPFTLPDCELLVSTADQAMYASKPHFVHTSPGAEEI